MLHSTALPLQVGVPRIWQAGGGVPGDGARQRHSVSDCELPDHPGASVCVCMHIVPVFVHVRARVLVRGHGARKVRAVHARLVTILPHS